LLGYPGLGKGEDARIRGLLSRIPVIGWNRDLCEETIGLRRRHSVKLPDALVAATSLVRGVPLVTADRGFSKMDGLELVLVDPFPMP